MRVNYMLRIRSVTKIHN